MRRKREHKSGRSRTAPADTRDAAAPRLFRLKPVARIFRKAAFPAGLILSAGTVMAGPQGGRVTAGQGSISTPDANTTLINQQSSRMAVDWTSFNIKQQELVRFNQPSSSASALNRIYDQNPSQIYGSLRANGQVVLVNPNGVFFSPTARVNVGSLVASGLDIDTGDFMEGKYNFQSLAGKEGGLVVNQGVIQAATGGSVSLIGGAVRNEGLILATAGRVNLAAGRKVTMDFDGDGLMQFTVDEEVLQNARGLDSAVSNSGEIRADGGSVVLSGRAAQDVFTHVVNNEGIVRAGRIENDGGTIRLVAGGSGSSVINTGTIDASGSGGNGGRVELIAEDKAVVDGSGTIDVSSADGQGGTAHVLGDRAGLLGMASIDASGAYGGGEVLVGGDYQGSNPDIDNATATYVGENTSINADATDDGDGGKVVIWADGTTRFHGTATARGGAGAGDGGVIETSGKEYLDISSSWIDASAANGKAGTWLLDPTDVDIVAGTAQTDGSFSGGSPDVWAPNNPGTTSTIGDLDIETKLNAGTSVTITTDDGTSSSGNGDVTQAGAATIDFTGLLTDVTFRIDAAGTITLDGGIDSTLATAALNVNLNANDNSGSQNDPNTSVGSVDINAAITTNGGNFSSSGIDFDNTGGSITTAGGNITIDNSGTVTLGADLDAGAGSISGTATDVLVQNTGGSVQDGIDIIDTGSGGTVTVGDGTFTEDLDITTDNLLLTSLNGKGSTTIQGVSSDSQANFPLYQNATNILIDAGNVTLDDLTLETPSVAAGDYAALITLIGDNITITNNDFVSTQGDTAPAGSNDSLTNIMIQSIGPGDAPAGSINGLTITGNTFTGDGKGYYGVYLNQQGAAVGTAAGDEVTIDGNTFNGNIWRAVSTERSNVDITNNTLAPAAATVTAWGGSGIAARNFTGTTIDDVLIDNNTFTTGGANGEFASEILLGFADTDPLTDIVVTNESGHINVTGDVSNTATLAWDTTGDINVDVGASLASSVNVELDAGGAINLADSAVNATGDVVLVAASITDDEVGETAANIISGSGVIDLTATGSIGAADSLDVAGVTDLSVDVGNSFDVNSSDGSTLTDLTVKVDAGDAAADSYFLTGFGGGLSLGLSDSSDNLLISGTAATAALNIAIEENSGDILLDDEGTGVGNAAVDLSGGGDITLSASAGNIVDNTAQAGDAPATQFNLRTNAANTVSLKAPSGDVGASGDGDIDISGTSNLALDAAASYVQLDTALASLSLTLDPVNEVVDLNLSGTTTIDIDEACLAGNVCINSVDNSGSAFDFSLTGTTGDILLADNAIANIGDGNVTLDAQAGAINEINNNTTANITAGGTITLSARDGIGDVSTLDIADGGSTDGVNLSLARTNNSAIDLISSGDTTVTGFSSSAFTGTTTLTTQSPQTVSTDMIQVGDINLVAGESGSAGDDLTLQSGVTVQSTTGNVTLRAGDDVVMQAGTSGNETTVSAAGNIILNAAYNDADNAGLMNIGDYSLITAAGTGVDAVTFQGLDLVMDTTGNTLVTATGVGGGIRFFTEDLNSSGTYDRTMELGGAGGADFSVTDNELDLFPDFDNFTVGEQGVQAGQITLVTASTVGGPAAVQGANLIANADAGAGSIYLDDDSGGTPGTAVATVSGDITLRAGTGGITANANNGATAVELDTSGTINLISAGAIGSNNNSIEFASPGTVNVTNTGSNTETVLRSTSDFTLGTVTTSGGRIHLTHLNAADPTITLAGNISTSNGDVDIRSDGNLTVNAGVTIDAGTGNIGLIAELDDNNSAGTLTLNDNATVTSATTSSTGIGLFGDDIVISTTGGSEATVSATGVGGGIMVRGANGAESIELGGTGAGADISLSDAEFDRFTDFDHFTLGVTTAQTGDITLTTVDHATVNDAAIHVEEMGAGTITLDDGGDTSTALAAGSGAITLISGTGGITSANATNTTAELATTGAITLTSSGAVGSSSNRIQFPAGQDQVTVTNAPGGVWLDGLGNLTLSGVTTGGGAADITATGTLAVIDGASVTTGGNTLAVTVDDLNLNTTGALNSGAAATTITDADGSDGILIGNVSTPLAGGVNLSNAELDNITATGLTLQSANTIFINTVSDPAGVSGTLTADAGIDVRVQGGASSFSGIALDLQADDRVDISVDLSGASVTLLGDADNDGADVSDDVFFVDGVTVTATAGAITLGANGNTMTGAGALNLNSSAGLIINDSLTTSGTLTVDDDTDSSGTASTFIVSSGATVTTGNNPLNITTADIVLNGTIDSGTATTTITTTAANAINLLGGISGQYMNFDTTTELGNISAGALVLVSPNDINVNGVTAASTANITGTTILDAAGNVNVTGTSIFTNGVDAQADGNVSVQADLTAGGAGIILTGDTDTSGAGTVAFSGARALTVSPASAGGITLGANGNTMTADNTLDLSAPDGVTINDSLTVAGTLTINANTDGPDDDGLLSLAAGTLSTAATNAAINLTAEDLAIAGGAQVNAGSGQITIVENEGDGVGLGAAVTASGMDITDTELDSILTTGTLFIDIDKNINVDQVSNTSAGLVRLRTNSGHITFENNASSFAALTAESGWSLFANTDLTTTVGDMTLVADHNNDGGADVDHVRFADGVTVNSAGALNLDVDPTQDGSDIEALGDLALTAAGHLNILQDFNWNAAAGAAIDLNAGGTFFVESGQTLDATTSGQALNVTAADIDLAGNLANSAAGINLVADTMNIQGTATVAAGGEILARQATNNTAISLGATASTGLALTDAELNRLNADVVRVGDANSGAISFAGAYAADADSGDTTLALQSGATVTGTAGAIDLSGSGGGLAVRAGGAVTLDNTGNDFNLVAVDASSAATGAGGVTLRDANSLDIGSVDTLSGISVSTDSAVDIRADADGSGTGLLTVSDDIAATGTGTVTLDGVGVTVSATTADTTVSAVNGDITVNARAGTLTLTDTADPFIGLIETTGTGSISVTADDLVEQTNDAGNQPQLVSGNNLTLAPFTPGTTIALGDDAIGGSTFEFSDAEMDGLNFAGTLTIGNGTAGAVLLDRADDNPFTAGTGDLTVVTGSSIDANTAGGESFESAGTLTLTSGAAIGTGNALELDVAAVNVTSTGGNDVTLTDTSATNDVGDTTYTIATGGTPATVTITQAADNILLDRIDAGASGTINLQASAGAIEEDVDDTGSETDDLIANSFDLNASTGIGITNGTIEAQGANLVAASTDTGGIDLSNAADAAVLVNDLSTTTGGTILYTQTGNQAATLNSITSVNGDVTLQIQGGAGADASIGAITADTVDDIVHVIADGAINDANAGDLITIDITADTVDLDAVTGIGASEPLELAVSTVTADTTGGAITLSNDSATDAGASTLTTSGADISFTQTGTGQLLVSTVSTDGVGSVTLNAEAGMILTGAVTTAGGDITINADTDGVTTGTGLLELNTSGALTTGGGDLFLTAADFNFLSGSSALSLGGGALDISFTRAGDLCLGNAAGICQINLDNTDIGVLINATNSLVLDNSGSLVFADQADFLTLSSLTLTGLAIDDLDGAYGISSSGSLALTLNSTGTIGTSTNGFELSQVASVDFSAADAVELTVASGGNATTTVTGATTANDGDVTVSALDKTLTIGAAGLTAHNVGTVFVGSPNAGTDIILNGNVGAATNTTTVNSTGSITGTGTVSGATVQLFAVDEIGAGGSEVATAADSLTAQSSGAGDVYLNEADAVTLNTVSAASGLIDIDTLAAGDIELDGAVNASGTVDITTFNGSILDADGNGSVNGTTVTLDTTAGTGSVGTAANAVTVSGTSLVVDAAGEANVATTVDTIDIDTTAAGAVNVTETGGVTLTNITTTDGAITVTAANAITATDVVSTTDSPGNDITITSTGAGVAIDRIAAGTGNGVVTVDAQAGAITQDADAVSATEVTANTVDLDATAGISNGSGGQLNIAASVITADVTGGDLRLDNTQASGTTLNSLSTAGGLIDYDQTGGGAVVIDNGGTGVVSNSGIININVDGGLTVDDTIDSTAGAGTLTIGGGVTLTGNANLQVGSAITLNGGGDDIVLAGTISSANALDFQANRDILVQGLVQTTAGASAVTLRADADDSGSGGVKIDTAGQVDANGDAIITGSAWSNLGGADDGYLGDSVIVVADGGNDQVVAGGSITLQQNTAATLAGTEDIIIEGLVTGTGTGAVTVDAADTIELASTVSSNGGAINFADAVSLTGTAAADSTDGGAVPGGADITFQNAVDGGNNLTLNSGSTGNIAFNGAVGGGARLGTLAVTNANDVNASSTLTAGAISQSAGQGTTTFSGAVDTNTAAGIALTGNAFSFNGGVTTTGTGGVTVDNAGLLTIANGSPLTLDGAFSQDSTANTGTTSLDDSISTTGDSIAFAEAVVLSQTVSLVTTAGGNAGGADIGFGATLDAASAGVQGLTLDAGTGGNITFTGAVGTTRLGTLAVTDANDVTASSTVSAGALSQAAGQGTTMFNGALDTNTGAGIDLNGSAFTFNDTVTTTNAGTVTVTNSGLLSIADAANMILDGGFTVDGAGNVSTEGNITTSADDILFSGAGTVTVGANDAVFNSGGGNIQFNGDVTGAGLLTLTAGAGTTDFNSTIGSGGALSGLLVSSAAGLNFAGTVAVDDENLDLNATAISIADAVTTTTGGTVTITNAGLLDMAPAADLSLDGAFLQDGAGAVQTAGDITTTGDTITFQSGVTLTDGGLISLATTSGVPAGADISFGSTVDAALAGVEDLTLDAGTGGNIGFTGAVGATRLGTLAVTNANNVTASSTVSAAAVSQTAGQGTTQFDGAVDTNTAAGIDLNGNAFTFNSTVTTTGTGGIAVTNAGTADINAKLTSAGPVLFDGTGGISLAADMEATDAASSITVNDSILTLNSDVSLITNNGGITLDEVQTDTDGAHTLILSAGSGNIDVDDNIGVDGTGELAALRITDAGNVDFSTAASEIHVGELNIGNPLVPFNDTPVLNDVHFSALVKTDTGPITVQASTVTVDGILDTTDGGASGGNLFIGSGVTLNATPNVGAFDIFLNGVDQDTIITAPINDNVPVTITATRDVIINADVTTSAGDITVTADTDLADPLANGYGGVVVNSTGSVNATSGNVIITGTSFTNEGLSGSRDPALDTYIGNAVSVVNDGAADQVSAGGNITLQGSTVNPAGNQAIAIEGLITALGAGTVTFDADQNNDGTDLTYLASTVSSNGGAINFADAVSLTGTAAADSTDGGAVPGGADITFQNAVDGGNNLTLNSGTAGNIAFNGAVGGGARLGTLAVTNANDVTASSTLTAGAISQSAGQGTTTFSGAVDTNTAAGIALTGNAFSFNGGVTTTGTGGVTVDNAGLLTIANGSPLTLDGAFSQDSTANTGTTSLDDSISTTGDSIAFAEAVVLSQTVSLVTTAGGNAGGADIGFGATLDAASAGVQGLTLDAGTGGNITFTGAVGTTRLGTLAVTNANDVTASSTVSAGALSQAAGQGTTMFNGALDTNTGAGIDLNGSAFTFNDTVTTTNAGTVTVTNSGLLSIAAAADLTLEGAFLQDGAGAVQTAGDIDTSNDAITFNGPLTLTGNVDMDSTGASAGDISFNNSIDMGGFDLALDGGPAGNVTLAGAVSNGGNLTVRDGNVQSYQGLTLNALDIQDASTSITFNGNIAAASTLHADSGGTLTQNGQVTSGTSLDFDAAGTMAINSTGSVSGTLDLEAATLNVNADLTSTGADIILSSTGNTSLTGGAVLSAATTLSARVDSANAAAAQLDLGDATLDGTTVTLTGGSGGGNDTLLAQDLGNAWVITGANSGTLANANITTAASVGFNNFQNLTGGTANDSFSITSGSISGTIDGDSGPGTGNDTLTYAGGPTATITLAGLGSLDGFLGNATNVNGFDNINTVVGSGGSDTLVANITAGGEFNVQAGNDNYQSGGRTLTFNAVENLTGGGGNDTFNIDQAHTGSLSDTGGDNTYNINAVLTGNISSAGGNDIYTFDANVTGGVTDSGGNNTFNLETGFNSNITAGGGSDIFNFNGGQFSGNLAAAGGSNVYNFNGGTASGNVSVTGTDTWNHAAGVSLGSSVTGGGSLTVPDSGGGDLVLGPTDLNLPNMLNFTGHLIVGGTITPTTLPLDGNTQTVINSDRVTINTPVDLGLGGGFTVLSSNLDLNADITAGASGPTGGQINLIAVGDANGGSGPGDITAIQNPTTLSGGGLLMIAQNDIVNAPNINVELGGELLEVAIGSGNTPQFGFLDAQQDLAGTPETNAFLANLNLTNATFVQAQVLVLGNLIGLEQVVLIDLGLFEEDLSLFGVIGRGVALHLAQCEEVEGCAPNVTEAELNELIAQLEGRVDELQRRLQEASGSRKQRIEDLLDGYERELENFRNYRIELQEYYAAEDELEGDEFTDEFTDEGGGPEFTEEDAIAAELKRLNDILKVAKRRVEWLESLKTDADARDRLGELSGMDLTVELLDEIIRATRQEILSLEQQIQNLLNGKEASADPVFHAESGDYGDAVKVGYDTPFLDTGDPLLTLDNTGARADEYAAF